MTRRRLLLTTTLSWLLLACGGERQPATDSGFASDATWLSYCDFSEPNDTPGSAVEVEFGMSLAAVCPKGDRDFYKFEVEAGESFTILVIFESVGDLDLRLLDGRDQAVLKESATRDDFELIRGDDLAAGVYIAEVYSSGGSAENDYRMELSAAPKTHD